MGKKLTKIRGKWVKIDQNCEKKDQWVKIDIMNEKKRQN